MKLLSLRLSLTLPVLLAITASKVQADYLNWTYTANPNVPGISVNSSSPQGGASVTLTNFNTPQAGAASIPVVAYVTSTSSTSPITFGPSSDVPTSYNLALTISDGTTHDSGTLNFTGTLAGALTATSSSVVNTLTPVTSDSLILDGYKYTVTIPSVTLASPTSPQRDITAQVTVTPIGSPVPGVSTGGNGGTVVLPLQTPEPGSIVLACMGLACVGASGVRRFRRREA